MQWHYRRQQAKLKAYKITFYKEQQGSCLFSNIFLITHRNKKYIDITDP